MPGFEVYLQFDSLEREPLLELRGADLRAVRRQALERLNALGVSTTLVVTVKKGLNDGELGRIVEFALEQPCVRGVTFQPIQAAGRLEGFDPATRPADADRGAAAHPGADRRLRPEDIIPVPCHPGQPGDGLRAEAGRRGRAADRADGPAGADRGRAQHDPVRAGRPAHAGRRLHAVLDEPLAAVAARAACATCCAACPRWPCPDGLGYDNVFRVLIVQFIDAYSFDVRSVKKTCVHIVHPDGRLIPFDTYNLFYRDDLEQTRLEPLRALHG